MNSDEDDSDEDPEMPDPSDMDDPADGGEEDVVECPTCHAMVYERSPYCPHCGGDIDANPSTMRKTVWTVAVVFMFIAVLIYAIH